MTHLTRLQTVHVHSWPRLWLQAGLRMRHSIWLGVGTPTINTSHHPGLAQRLNLLTGLPVNGEQDSASSPNDT